MGMVGMRNSLLIVLFEKNRKRVEAEESFLMANFAADSRHCHRLLVIWKQLLQTFHSQKRKGLIFITKNTKI